LGKQPNSSRNVSHKSYSISSEKSKQQKTTSSSKKKGLQLTIITRNPKTEIANSVHIYLRASVHIFYSCTTPASSSFSFSSSSPQWKKQNPKENKEQEETTKERVHTKTNKKHGT